MKTPLLWKSAAAGFLVVAIIAATVLISRREAPAHNTSTRAQATVSAPAHSPSRSVSSSSSRPAISAASSAPAQGFARVSQSTASGPSSTASGRWYAAQGSSSPRGSSSSATTSHSNSQPATSSSVASSPSDASPSGDPSTSSAPAEIDVIEQAPLPVSAQLSGYEVDGLTQPEQNALNQARKQFTQDVNAAPVQDTTDPAYYDEWEDARRSNDSYLRSALGWQTFNGLSAEGAQAMLDQQRSAANQ